MYNIMYVSYILYYILYIAEEQATARHRSTTSLKMKMSSRYSSFRWPQTAEHVVQPVSTLHLHAPTVASTRTTPPPPAALEDGGQVSPSGGGEGRQVEALGLVPAEELLHTRARHQAARAAAEADTAASSSLRRNKRTSLAVGKRRSKEQVSWPARMDALATLGEATARGAQGVWSANVVIHSDNSQRVTETAKVPKDWAERKMNRDVITFCDISDVKVMVNQCHIQSGTLRRLPGSKRLTSWFESS